MTTRRLGRWMMTAMAAATAACVSATDDEVGAGTDTGTDASTATSDAADTCDSSLYPCAPYGTNADDVMTNLSFVGRSDTNGDGTITSKDDAGTIALSKFYQDKNVRALIVSASAQWCSPCRAEQPELQALHEEHAGKVGILEAMVQKLDGTPSVLATADVWRDEFGLTFDVVIDPSNVLAPYYDISAFPMNMVVDPRTMKIVYQSNGGDMDSMKSVIDALVATPR